MFAIVRTGGKQYRVAPGDKIVVEKLAGEAGDSIDLTDVLLAGEGSDLKSTAGLIVGAEIVAQAKADKVTVFKKRRRHNYRRKAGHRQQLTILRIVSIGGEKPVPSKAEGADKKPAKTAVPVTADAPVPAVESTAAPTPAPRKAAAKPAVAKAAKPVIEGGQPAATKPVVAEKPAKPAAKASTKDAAPAKAAPKKAAPKAAASPEKK